MPVFHYQLRKLEEIYTLSSELAQYFPDPTEVQIGIHELLINAVEHGNLAISEQLKYELVRESRWQEEVERRLQLPEYRDRHVEVVLEVDGSGCRLTITDQGAGFDWQNFMTGENMLRYRFSGLGLRMVTHAGFNTLVFNEKGNQVHCAVHT